MFSLVATILTFFFGVVHMVFMKHYTAFSYVIIGGGAAYIITYSTTPILSFDPKIMDNYQIICDS